MKKNGILNFFRTILIILIPFFIVIMVEAVSRRGFMSAFNWFFGTDIEWIALVGSYLVVSAVMLFFIGLFGRLHIGAICTFILFGIISVVQYFKVQILGESFYPWDLAFIGHTGDLANFINFKFSINEVLFLLFILLGCFIVFYVYKGVKVHWVCRLLLLVISAGGFYYGCIDNTPFKQFLQDNFKYDANIYLPTTHYDENGFIFSFATNLSNTALKVPNGYSKEVALQLIDKYENSPLLGEGELVSSNNVKPDIVIILNEAFTLPTNLPNVSYSKNPTPFYDKMREEAVTGFAISPAYGGGTSNVEFEVLTGFSNRNVLDGQNVYSGYINSKLESIPWLLKDNGYNSFAIHTYKKEFFRRHIVYPLLGIDDYIAMEDIRNPEQSGFYISDNQFVDLIIDNYEKKKAESDQSTFVLGISMENHAPYRADKYSEYDIDVSSDVLNVEQKGALQSYVQAAYNSDKSMEKLIEYFKTRENPVIVLMFGDHFPALDSKFGVYKSLGIINSDDTDEWTLDQTEFMHSVPYFMWANYTSVKGNPDLMSTNYLGNMLLSIVGLDKSPYLKFLDIMYYSLPVIKDDLVIDSLGNKSKEMFEQYKQLDWEQSILQYYYMVDK